MEMVKIGIAGLGTVGGGVCRVLSRNGAEIAARAGVRFEVKRSTCRRPEAHRDLEGMAGEISSDWRDIVNPKKNK